MNENYIALKEISDKVDEYNGGILHTSDMVFISGNGLYDENIRLIIENIAKVPENEHYLLVDSQDLLEQFRGDEHLKTLGINVAKVDFKYSTAKDTLDVVYRDVLWANANDGSIMLKFNVDINEIAEEIISNYEAGDCNE